MIKCFCLWEQKLGRDDAAGVQVKPIFFLVPFPSNKYFDLELTLTCWLAAAVRCLQFEWVKTTTTLFFCFYAFSKTMGASATYLTPTLLRDSWRYFKNYPSQITDMNSTLIVALLITSTFIRSSNVVCCMSCTLFYTVLNKIRLFVFI